MATSKEYLEYIIGSLSELEDISYRAMMGEYIIYYRGRIAGGLYDDRFLIKNVPSAVEYIGEVEYAIPYDGAKPMILVDNVDDKEHLKGLFLAMYEDLPKPKCKKMIHSVDFYIKQ